MLDCFQILTSENHTMCTCHAKLYFSKIGQGVNINRVLKNKDKQVEVIILNIFSGRLAKINARTRS